ncbi:MAG: DUF3426 domain-containing protein [Desulfuromonadales bacterium]|nr:DUF3426 domain-containing protein [Desulfuromonadales bacterium]
MIIQCDECQARFRLADEKIKPTGTKVRCSKCKHVFTVMPPPAEPAEELDRSPEQETATDFATAATAERTEAPEQDTATAGQPGATTDEPDAGRSMDRQEDDAPFSGPESDFVEKESFEESPDSSNEVESGATTADQQTDAMEFDFADQGESPVATADQETAPTGEDAVYGEFDFGEPADDRAEFAFGDDESVGISAETATAESFAEETDVTDRDAFSFDDDDSAGSFGFETDHDFAADTGDTDWSDDHGDSTAPLDIEEPSFGSQTGTDRSSDGEEAGFGEIDFPDDEEDRGGGLSLDDSFAPPPPLETESRSTEVALPVADTPPESRSAEEIPIPRPKRTVKQGRGRSVALLFVLLLLALAGGVGYLSLQDGGLSVAQLTKRFPFLQPYLGQPDAVEEAPKIDITIAAPVYVNNPEAGQLLVVQGQAINNYATPRSSITVKGLLLDSQDRTLMQQTVFCGNPLSENDLNTLPFAKIEEAMNNEFGDSLSNMNVAAKAKIPFTVVFRNLPEGIANISIVVVDSKPGSR